MPPREAAAEGVAATAGTVTSAAIVMVAVFSIFATLDIITFKQLGVGLAAAVLLNATVVRGIALPAVVALLGQRKGWTSSGQPRAVAAGRRGSPDMGCCLDHEIITVTRAGKLVVNPADPGATGGAPEF